ncbi:MAG TPA: FKBP-type peptidyl-prolyl cis-trans isomerase [Mycobacteriales bacterium]|nr:FKBP-type peptidyl-prolyl cis-trans isomerase [Mycobacteriales bacterium]
MRNRWAWLLAGLLAGGVVTGCATTSAPGPTVTGAFGTDPVIAIPNGKPGSDLVVDTLIKGRGPVVGTSDYVLLNVEGKVWAGDRLVVDSFTDRQPQGLPLSTAMPAWRKLAGARVGSRVLMIVPPKDGFGAAGNPQANIMGSDTLVFVFDVVDSIARGTAAAGTPVAYHPGPNMPSVGAMTKSGPKISIPTKAKPPATLTSTVLRKGTGPAIISGDTVVAQYTGAVWRTGKVFDSSWNRGFPQSFVLGAGQVVAGWEQGLGGHTVGSRILLTVPATLGYGDQGKPPDINGTDTLVFVVDIVAAS